MPSFRTSRIVGHSPRAMFDLVADVEKYPQFLPLCEALVIKSRETGSNGDANYLSIEAIFKAKLPTARILTIHQISTHNLDMLYKAMRAQIEMGRKSANR